MKNSTFPTARKQDLVIQDVHDKLFIYDLKTDKVYSLNSTSAFVWNNLNGETSVEELSLKVKETFNQSINEDFVWLAIDGLRKFGLLEEGTAPRAMSKIKRREALKRIGLATMSPTGDFNDGRTDSSSCGKWSRRQHGNLSALYCTKLLARYLSSRIAV